MHTYSYKLDKTLRRLNKWRVQLGLPTRLQHPPLVQGSSRRYIFVDFAPLCTCSDGSALLVGLASVGERRKLERSLRSKVQNSHSGGRAPSTLELPPSLRGSPHYPMAGFTDDDAGKTKPNYRKAVAARFRELGGGGGHHNVGDDEGEAHSCF